LFAGDNVSICQYESVQLQASVVWPPNDPVVFSENFGTISDGAIPAGWTRTHTNWGANSSSNAGGVSPELRFNWTPNETAVFRVRTPLINTENATGLNLSFRHNLDHFSGNYTLRMQTSPDGNTWTNRWTLINPGADVSATQVNVNLSVLDGQSFYVAFVFDGDSYNVDYWYIDNILLTKNIAGQGEIVWSPSESLNENTILNPIASPVSTQTYTITAIFGECSVSDEIMVIVNPVPENPINISADPPIICPGASSNIKANSPGNSIRWWSEETGGELLVTLNSGELYEVFPETTTTYWVESFDVNECVSYERIAVTVEVAEISLAADGIASQSLILVLGESTVLFPDGGHLGWGAEWEWFEGDCETGVLLGTGNEINVQPQQLPAYYSLRATGNCNTTDCVQAIVNESLYGGCDVIYVSPLGHDSYNASPDFPIKTLYKAMSMVTDTRKHIKMAEGTYNENHSTNMLDGVIIDGGYVVNGVNWTKSSNAVTHIHYVENTEGTNPTVVEEDEHIRHLIGIKSDKKHFWTIQDCTITTDDVTGLAADGRGSSNYALWIFNSGEFAITRCNITSGNASSGMAGETTIQGGTFGLGGAGAPAGNNVGLPGLPGDDAGELAGGAGGNGGAGCPSDCRADNGAPGETGEHGDGYAAGDRPVISLTAGLYFMPLGQSEDGTAGAGGGGGGGGGGSGYTDILCAARAGGAGGRGGRGGNAGTGGFGGGGSFAVWMYLPDGDYNFDYVNTTHGNYGMGGDGGAGEAGETSETGATGSLNSSFWCGSNKGGGDGGTGGNGGNGGRGRDGGNGLAYEVVIDGVASNQNSVIPTHPIVSVHHETYKLCNNSEIQINKASNAWYLPDGLQFVNDINPTQTSYNNSSANAKVYASQPDARFNLTSPLNYPGFIITDAVNRPLPVITLSELSFCASETSTLSVSAETWSNEYEYEWLIFESSSTNPLLSSNLAAPQFNIGSLEAGTYHVSYRVKERCCGWSIPVYSSFIINTIPPAPVSQGDVEVCENLLPQYLMVNTNGSYVVDWYDAPEGGNLLLEASFTYPCETPGTYYAESRIPNTEGCTSLSRTAISLTTLPVALKAVNPAPAHNQTQVSVNTNLAWLSGGNTTSYDVYFGTYEPGSYQANIPGTSFVLPVLDYETQYFWRIDAKNNCGTTTGDVWTFVTADAIGIDTQANNTGNSILVSEYNNRIVISVPNNERLMAVELYTAHGAKLLSTKQTVIDVSGLAPGMYMVRVSTNLQQHSAKVLID